MKKNNVLPIALVVIAVALIGFKLYERYNPVGGGGGGGTVVPVVGAFNPPASDDLKTRVAPITVALQSSEHAEELAYFFRAVGKAILKNAQSAQQAREIHSMAGKELYEQNPYITYNPSLAPLVEKILDDTVGKANTKYEDADRAKVAAVFEAIAWAAYQAKAGGFFSTNVVTPEASKSQVETLLAPLNTAGASAYECELVIDPVTGAKYCDETGLVGVTFDMANGLIDTPMEGDAPTGLPQALPPEANPEAAEPVQDPNVFPNPPPAAPLAEDDPTYLLTHGLLFSEQEYEQFASENVTFGDLNLPTGEGKVSLLYRALRVLDKTAYESEKQTTGDCFIPANSSFWDEHSIPEADRETAVSVGSTKQQLSGALVGSRVKTLLGDNYVSTYFVKKYSGAVVEIRIVGLVRPLFCTSDHLILTRDGWVAAARISRRSHVLCEDGKFRRVSRLVSRLAKDIEVNCIEVPAAGHFFANGAVVHNCTSHATRNACDTSRAYEIIVTGDHEDFITRGATEPIYGYRGHSGAGMSVYRAAKWVNEVGGFAIRKNYEGIVDLSVYNAATGTRWGASGPPRPLVEVIAPHKVQSSVLVKNINEARDSLCNGYAIIVGSGYSFSPTRDRYGFAARTPQGWSHAMAWVATAPMSDLIPGNTSDEPCFLIVNSWGKWNSGPKGKYSDIPDGSFWITPDAAAGMIKQQQAIAVGNFNGFVPAPLKNWGAEYLAIEPVGTYTGKPSDPQIYGLVAVNTALTMLKGTSRFNITTPDDGAAPNGGKRVIVLPDGSTVIYEDDVPIDIGPAEDIPVVINPMPPAVITPVVQSNMPDLSDPTQARVWEMSNPNNVVVNGTPQQRPAPYFAAQGTYVLPGVWQEVSPEGSWGLYRKSNGEWHRVPSSEFPELDRKLPAPSRYPIGEKEELQLKEQGDVETRSSPSNMVEPRGISARRPAELASFGRWLEDSSYQLAC